MFCIKFFPILLFTGKMLVATHLYSSMSPTISENTNLQLWYESPAEHWMSEALPIGNGFMGAMVFGGIERERIQFNEESLWSGGKGEWEQYNGGNRPEAYKYLPEVRRLLDLGNYQDAHRLANRELTGIIQGNHPEGGWIGFGAYQNMGDLWIEVDSNGTISNYRRSLDLQNSTAEVTYTDGRINHHRTYFASHPRRMLVFNFENDAAGGVDYIIKLTTPHSGEMYYENGVLKLNGNVKNNGMTFQVAMLLDAHGSDMVFDKKQISISGSNQITLYLTANTEYLNEYPHYQGQNFDSLNRAILTEVPQRSYHEILREHINDYRELFDRVTFTLAANSDLNIPTDLRLQAYANGTPDPGLEALFFQYGRYLLISSSRPGTLPANLQGKWNHSNNPPWACDYHANINIQMIYWPAEVTNLADCHLPLIDYIDNLRPPGRITAKAFFNASGWVVNTMNNIFGFTAPGWEFPWGFFPGGAAWYSRHAWEHYLFNPDTAYLNDKAYPIMKEAAEFWVDYLGKDPDGYWVSSPSYSPEHGGISTGAYMDIQIVHDLFTNTIEAAKILEVDTDFREQLESILSELLPLRIGRWGQLQEWKEDLDDPDNKHRHVSHLYALYPGNQINMLETPKLAEASRVSLNARGDEGTGWSLGWKINFWARLMDGDRAYKLLKRSLRITDDSGINMSDGGGVYSNLLSAHPPFQLDGNMGFTSGVAEMLVQSHTDTIQLLPALPNSWPAGRVTGLKLRGGLTIDLEWEDMKLIRYRIESSLGGKYLLRHGDTIKTIELASGESVSFGSF